MRDAGWTIGRFALRPFDLPLFAKLVGGRSPSALPPTDCPRARAAKDQPAPGPHPFGPHAVLSRWVGSGLSFTLALVIALGVPPAAARVCADGGPAAIAVTQQIGGIDTVTNRSIAALGDLWRAESQRPPPPLGSIHLLGLYTADHGAQTQLGFRTLTDPDGSVCLSITDVTVRLSLQNRLIYVGRELTRGSCVHRVVLAHERRHAAVSEQVIADAAVALRRDLPGIVAAQRPNRAIAEAEVQATVDRLTDAIGGAARAGLAAALDLATARHAAIDAPAQLRSEQAQCGDDFPAILGRLR